MNKQKKSILIVGGDSFLGTQCVKLFVKKNFKVFQTYKNKRKTLKKIESFYLNLNNNSNKWNLPKEDINYAIICSSKTSLKFCEKKPQLSKKINVISIIKLIDILNKKKIFIIYPSSNLVFSGKNEFSKINEFHKPFTQYGIQKSLVEKYINKKVKNRLIIRFSKILNPKSQLINKWLRKFRTNSKIHVYPEAKISPVTTNFATEIIAKCIKMNFKGVLNVSANNEISYLKFAKYIQKKFNFSSNLINEVSFDAITSKFFPLHSTLDTTLLKKKIKLFPKSIYATIDELLGI